MKSKAEESAAESHSRLLNGGPERPLPNSLLSYASLATKTRCDVS
jgi:hypothetical protein